MVGLPRPSPERRSCIYCSILRRPFFGITGCSVLRGSCRMGGFRRGGNPEGRKPLVFMGLGRLQGKACFSDTREIGKGGDFRYPGERTLRELAVREVRGCWRRGRGRRGRFSSWRRRRGLRGWHRCSSRPMSRNRPRSGGVRSGAGIMETPHFALRVVWVVGSEGGGRRGNPAPRSR